MTPCLIAKPSTSRLSVAKGAQILGSLFYIWKNSAFRGEPPVDYQVNQSRFIVQAATRSPLNA
jgi:hypothetical protein